MVPNIVHYLLFNVTEIKFGHFISFLSVLKNQKPEKVYIHCDCSQLNGDYYQRVLRVANKTNTPIIVRTIERPTQIFGKSDFYSTKYDLSHKTIQITSDQIFDGNDLTDLHNYKTKDQMINRLEDMFKETRNHLFSI